MFARRALSAAAACVASQCRWESTTPAATYFGTLETALKHANTRLAVAALAKKLANLAEVRFPHFFCSPVRYRTVLFKRVLVVPYPSFYDAISFRQKHPSVKLMLAQPPAPSASGFLFPRDSVLDYLFKISRRENPVPRMYFGYSGKGMTTAMQMAMAQFRRMNGANFCVRACHVSFRDHAALQHSKFFIDCISNAIGGYSGMFIVASSHAIVAASRYLRWLTFLSNIIALWISGNDDSDQSLKDRLASRVAQLADAFRNISQARVEMPASSAPQSVQHNQESQQTVVQSTELVHFVPVLWIDDLHCLDAGFATALVQSLFLFPFPVIITVSERDGLTRIMNGTYRYFHVSSFSNVYCACSSSFLHNQQCIRLWHFCPPSGTP
jgi:hypothetical protein